MLLVLNKPFENLDGSKSETNLMSKLLANLLQTINYAALPAVKAWDWAKALFNDGQLDIDTADIRSLKQFVEALRSPSPVSPGGNAFPGIVAQLLTEIDLTIEGDERAKRQAKTATA